MSKLAPFDGTDPHLHHGRDVAVFQGPDVADLVVHHQRHDAVRDIVEQRNLRLNAGQASAPGRTEGTDPGFLEHADDLYVVDVSVGVHVAPAHGNGDLDPLAAVPVVPAQLCTAVESSTGTSPASAPANWDMYRRW